MRIILFLLAYMIFPSLGISSTINEIRNNIEEQVARDKSIEHVVVKMHNIPMLNGIDNIEFLGFNYEDKSDLLKVFIKLEEVQHSFYAEWKEGVLLPSLIENGKRGEVIEESKLIYIKAPKDHRIKNYISYPLDLIGKQLKRNIPSQKPILFSDVTAPTLIKKNDKVNIQYNKNGISIETIGVALEDAGIGDMLKVKNIDSNKVVVAKAKFAGIVEVR